MKRHLPAALLLVATFACPAAAQHFQHPAPDNLDFAGSDIFRTLLGHRGLKPVSINDAEKDPQATVVVIYGRGPADENDRIRLAKLARLCIARGGAVLIATHQKMDLTPYLPAGKGQIGIDGRSVSDRGEGTHFRTRDGVSFFDVPFIRFVHGSQIPDRDLRGSMLLTKVASQKPSFITPEKGVSSLIKIAGFSLTARSELNQPADQLSFMSVIPGPGIAVIIADSEMLSNQFLAALPGDPTALNNAVFAVDLSSYLVRGPDHSRHRTQCVFWEYDRQQMDFDRVSLAPELPEIRPSWPMIEQAIAENVDRKLNELQEQDFPNRGLLNAIPFDTIMQRLGVFAAIATAIWLLRRVRSARSDREIPPENQAKIRPTTTAAALLQSKNLWSAAREKLRRQFADWQVPEQHHEPSVAVEGSWFYRNRMEKSVRTLWAIAFADSPVRVSKLRWAELDREIAGIDAALRTGQLRFPAAEPTS